MPGATSYEIQIDTVPTFDSPDLIDQTVTGTSYSHSFATLGTRYWRVRALPGGDWTAAWPFSITAGVVQVTTDQADDYSPALVQTADGKLLTVFVRNGNLWSRASTDGGATWAAETQIAGCCRYRPSLARAADGTLWLTYDRDGDIWYRTSADHGVTWSAETQLTTDPGGDYDPVIFQAADGKLWVVWHPIATGNYLHLVQDQCQRRRHLVGRYPAHHRQRRTMRPPPRSTSDGRLVVVWKRYDELWQRSSSDGGATWSAETQIADWDRYRPSLAAVGGDLWLAYEQGGDIWYRTSTDQGGYLVGRGTVHPFCRAATTAPRPQRWRRAASASPGSRTAAATRTSGSAAPASGRTSTRRPTSNRIEHQPRPNPDSDDTITFRARAMDETGVASVSLVWTLDGVAQADLPMFDDGTHGDDAAGDGVWSVQHAPLPEGSQVTYRARATDTDGNTYRYPGQNSFKVLPPFVKTAAILFVPDAGGNNTPTTPPGSGPTTPTRWMPSAIATTPGTPGSAARRAARS